MRGDDICLYLSPDARAALQALAADRNTPRKLVWRAGIVLATADGDGTFEIMFEIMRRRARPSKPTVWRWQARYLEEGVSGLKRDKTRRDKTRLSRVPPLPRETRLKVIARTVQESPPNATHWSRALMAVAVGISPSSVGRIRAQAGLKPHLTRRFKVSNDPLSEEKVTDIVGLCLDPPERAIVLCVDEKSRIQALDRTRPGLPLRKRRAATMTHNDKRHGTTTLFAVLDVKSGMVIGECRRATEPGSSCAASTVPSRGHATCIRCSTTTPPTRHPRCRAWLAKHPRFKWHFTPTGASWLNLVERFFAGITSKRIRRGSYTSGGELEATICDCLMQHNARPRPFIWSKTAKDILTRKRRALNALDEIRGNR